MPRLNGSTTTCAPAARAASAVPSTEPSEMTTTSSCASNARSSPMTRAMLRSSLYAGTIAIRRSPEGSADMRLFTQADQVEQAPRAVAVGVLLEHTPARAPAHLLGLRRIVEQPAVRGD